jgi:gliding motility-associated-like protein
MIMKKELFETVNYLSVLFRQNKLSLIIQFTLYFLFTSVSAQNFNVQLSSTEASCIGNGSISVSLSALTPESQIELNFFLLPNITTPFRTFSTNNTNDTNIIHVENALPAGAYTVIVTQATLNQTSEQSVNINIVNSATNLAFNTSFQAVCNGQNMTVNTISGNPNSYELRDSQGNTIAGPQASNVFNNVSAGNFLLIVTDLCGNSSGLTIPINATLANYVVYRAGSQFRFDNLSSCDSIEHTSRLVFNGSNQIPNERFPINLTYTIARQNGDTITNSSVWLSNADNFENMNIPFFAGESYNFIVTGYDNCGNTFSRTDLIVAEPKSLFRAFPAICGTKYLRISTIYRHYAPITVSFISYPAGFSPWNYNSNFETDSLSATFSTIPDNIDFGSPNMAGLPEGVYIIDISSCDRTETLTRQVINETQYDIVATKSYVGCDANQGSIALQIRILNTTGQADNFVSIAITDAPVEFTTQFGGLPYNVNNNIAVNGQFFMNSLPAGVYIVQAIGQCGIPLTSTFTIHPKQIAFSKTLTQACGVFSINTSLTSTLGNAVQWLQKYYPESGQWGHPLTGNLYTEGNNIGLSHGLKLSDATSGNGQTVSLGSFSNISSFGQFRVIVQYSIHSNGDSDNINCRDVVDTFNVEPFGITINDFFVFNCVNGNSELTVNASGIPPLSYSIIEINGVALANPILNGTNSVFGNLEPGQYKIRVEDLCGNVQTVTIQTNTTIPPVITPSNLCEGQNGTLTVWGLGNVNIDWQKAPSLDVIATGNTLTFQPFSFNNDAGTYLATINSPSGTCPSQIISIEIDTIPAWPNAGQGQVVDILESNTSSMNLFDILIPPFDNYGVWEDLTNSGQQNGAIFSAQNVNPGTYGFQYIVDGACSGSDTAFVVINIIPEALLASNDQISLECPVYSLINIGNVMQNDMHFGNIVNFNAYNIQTLVPDNQNAIAVDSFGNIWVNENATFNNTYQLTYQIAYAANPNITSFANLSISIGADLGIPIFVGNIPQDTLVACDNIPMTETLTAQNDCGPVVVTFSEEMLVGACANEYSLIRTWVANTIDNVQTIHIQTIQVVDTTAPNNLSLPEISVTCIDEIPTPNLNEVLALSSDNCGLATVEFLNDQSNNQSCPEIITRTYRISDDCGNFRDVYQNIIVHDTIAPWASNLANLVLSCIDELPASDIAMITDATDNCGLQSIIHLSDQSNNALCSEIITRTYRLQDACNNNFDVVQLFIIQDTIAPQASNPEIIMVSCPSDIPTADISVLTNVSDNCSTVSIQFTQDITNGNYCYGEQIQRIYTLSDACQNTSEVVQIINVEAKMANDLSIQYTNPLRCNADDGSISLSGLYPNYNYVVNFNGQSYDLSTNQNGTLTIGGLTAGYYSDFELLPLGCASCTIYSTLSVTLQDPEPPFISAGADFSLCEGNYAILFAENPQNAQINWDNGIENGIPFEIEVGQNTYVVEAKLLDCYAYDTVVITVHALPNIYAGEDLMICENEFVTLEATGGVNYQWSNFAPNGTPFQQTELQETYIVTGVDSNGCINSDTLIVTLISSPEPTFSMSSTESCYSPAEVQFANTTESTSAIEAYYWDFGLASTSSNLNQTSATFAEVGCHDVTLTLTYANGCSNTTTVTDAFCIYPSPEAKFEILTSNPQTGFPIVVNNSSENASWFNWNFGNEQSNFENPEIIFNEHGAQQITLIATNEFGCTDTTSQFIQVENVVLLYVPTAFTPNGDADNNTFSPVIGAGVQLDTYRLYIFNRWGEIVYETTDIESGWDGKIKNMDCPDGVYIWKIEFKASNSINEQHSGHVSLIR